MYHSHHGTCSYFGMPLRTNTKTSGFILAVNGSFSSALSVPGLEDKKSMILIRVAHGPFVSRDAYFERHALENKMLTSFIKRKKSNTKNDLDQHTI